MGKNNNVRNAKKIFVAMIVFIFASSLSPAEIQPPAKFRIFYGAGLSFPSGYLNEKYKVGVSQRIEIDFRFHKNLSLFAGLLHTFTSYDIQTEREPPPEWAWLPPEVYQNPPNVVFFPLRIGLSFRI